MASHTYSFVMLMFSALFLMFLDASYITVYIIVTFVRSVTSEVIEM
jgi:hypothetical protein